LHKEHEQNENNSKLVVSMKKLEATKNKEINELKSEIENLKKKVWPP